MRRLCPTADTACSVTESRGRREPPSPSAGRPAAIAPDDTRMQRWPAARTAAISVHSFAIDAWRIPPSGSVSDDDPILAMTINGASSVLGVLEREATDAHEVTLLRAGPRRRLVDPAP